MFNLTRQEKNIIIFISAVGLIGLGAAYFDKAAARIQPAPDFYAAGETRRLSAAAAPVNINTAGIKDLIKIKGIGPKTAQAIIEYRNSYGRFFYMEDIQKVRGIGPAKFDSIKKWITVE